MVDELGQGFRSDGKLVEMFSWTDGDESFCLMGVCIQVGFCFCF